METENESFSSSAHVVRTTAKHVISRRGNNENSCEMLENEKKILRGACKTSVSR